VETNTLNTLSGTTLTIKDLVDIIPENGSGIQSIGSQTNNKVFNINFNTAVGGRVYCDGVQEKIYGNNIILYSSIRPDNSIRNIGSEDYRIQMIYASGLNCTQIKGFQMGGSITAFSNIYDICDDTTPLNRLYTSKLGITDSDLNIYANKIVKSGTSLQICDSSVPLNNIYTGYTSTNILQGCDVPTSIVLKADLIMNGDLLYRIGDSMTNRLGALYCHSASFNYISCVNQLCNSDNDSSKVLCGDLI